MDRDFIGRSRELSSLGRRLQLVRREGAGTAVAIRGRRQVGKSRLVEHFCQEARRPSLYFQASRGLSTAESLAEFTALLLDSDLPNTAALPASPPANWLEAFKLLALALGSDGPSIVVIDELPWLMEQDPRLEGHLQTAWDRHLTREPVLMILVGSDLHMMEAFSGYGRPFYGRADTLTVRPLTPVDVATMTGLSGADALDAHLVTGGFPGLCRRWPSGTTADEHFADECEDAASPLFTLGASMVDAEFPNPDQTRRVLSAVGHGERSFANIAKAAGSGPQTPVPSGSLTPILHRLVDKHVVAVDAPLATSPGNGGRLYRIEDSYLRLHLAMLARAHEDVKRDRPDLALARIRRQWTAWRGRAIEPVIREALSRAAAAGALPWPDAETVGGWWPRSFDPEIDLVGADRGPVAKKVCYAGSIKWLGTLFDRHDLRDLHRAVTRLPGFTDEESGLVVVSRSGVADDVEADMVWTPEDVLAAWR